MPWLYLNMKVCYFPSLDYGDYESDSEIIANAHAMDWQLRDDLLAATKVV